ncbi:MAG TPA: hypothetical protein VFZ89_11025 [Solirubrobacteraceae bacterium]
MTATQTGRSRRSILVSCAALAVAGLVAGCGGEDEKEKKSGVLDPAKPVSFGITATAEGKKKGMIFSSTLQAGLVTMSLSNADTVPRSVQLLRIVGEHSIEEVMKVVTADGEEIPTWIQDGGGVPAVKPDGLGTATQVLAPGRYVLIDDEEGAGDNAKSNAELGAVGEFTVNGKRTRATLPPQPATITATDAVGADKKKTYGFWLEGLKAGTNHVHFQNTGAELHHALFLPMRKGATLEQAEQVLTTSRTPSGPPPVDFQKIVGTKVIDAGIEQNVTLELPAGRYAVICFVSDRAGGKSHVEKGMIEEVTVE